MRIDSKGLEKINGLQKKYKNVKSLTTEEFVNTYIGRCENCLEVCFVDDLKPIMNYKGKVYKCCETCQKELLNDISINGYQMSQEEYDCIYQEESRDLL